MVTLQDLKKISDYEWEIPQTYRQDMRVPVRLFATRRILEAAMGDKSLEQAVNAATLPGLVGQVLVMPMYTRVMASLSGAWQPRSCLTG